LSSLSIVREGTPPPKVLNDSAHGVSLTCVTDIGDHSFLKSPETLLL